MSKLRASASLLVVTLCALDCTVDREELSGGLGRGASSGEASPGGTGGSTGGMSGTVGAASGHPGVVAGSAGGDSGGNPSAITGGAASSLGGALSRAGGSGSSAAGSGSSAGGAGSSAGGAGSSAGGAGSSAAGTSGAGASAGGVSGTGTSAAGASGASATLLPFAVDSYFSASGTIGDAGSVQIQGSTGNCRPNAMMNVGQCWRVDFDAKGASAPSGYLWQYPANNTGQSPGLSIEAGAKQVLFSATGDKGGEQVTFFVGGAGTTATPYRDAFRIEKLVTLTTSAQTVTLDLSPVSYTNVIGGFGFTVAPGAASVRFFLSGIQWTK